MTALEFILIACATLRVSVIISKEDAPFALAATLRERLNWLSCIWCVSVWVGFGVVLLHHYAPLIVWGFAASGAAMLLRSYTGLLHDEPG